MKIILLSDPDIMVGADPRLMVVTCAEPLFLLSRVSSDAYEPYVFLKDHGEESLTPGGPLANPSS